MCADAAAERERSRRVDWGGVGCVGLRLGAACEGVCKDEWRMRRRDDCVEGGDERCR